MGIKVTLTPFISPEGYVTLNIKPEYSTVASEVRSAGQVAGQTDLAATLLSRRDLDLKNVRIKDGETLVIGGMIKESEQKIDFYRELINTVISKKSLLHSDQDVKKQLSKIEEDFGEYQLAVYLFSFSSFLEVMLLENYEEGYLNAIKNKIETYNNKNQNVDRRILESRNKMYKVLVKRIYDEFEDSLFYKG